MVLVYLSKQTGNEAMGLGAWHPNLWGVQHIFALDYLLKPFSRERLETAVARAMAHLETDQPQMF